MFRSQIHAKSLTWAFQTALSILLAASLATPATATEELTGDLPRGVYTFHDVDVDIHDVTVGCGPVFQGPPGLVRGIRVVVYGGKITVSGLIDATGAHGVNGDGGDQGVLPIAGTGGQRGCDVILETWPSGGTFGPLADWPVIVNGSLVAATARTAVPDRTACRSDRVASVAAA